MKIQKISKSSVAKASNLDKLEEVISKAKKENWVIAEEKIIAYEEKKGWKAEKVENCGYDILSIKGDQERHIEVKSKLGTGKKFGWTELTANETKQFRIDSNYFVYLVEGENIEEGAPFVVIELDKKMLEAIVCEYTIVRFTKLGSLPRTLTH